MYVTRPLSWLRRSPENLSLPPPEGPNSGLLVLCDEESEPTCCFGLYKRNSIANLPFPQNKDIRVWYSLVDVIHADDILFVPVLDQPLSSNRYYVIRRQGKHEGQACANSKAEDKGAFCCCSCTRDVDPRPLDPSDIYQQFEIFRRKYVESFYAKSVAPDGTPPEFLRRKDWAPRMSKPRHYQLTEALGVNPSLRANLPEFNFSLFSASSKPVVVGKWYCPFMFVKEEMSPKDQMRLSTFYEMTLEQRWDKIFGCDKVGSNAKEVSVDVVVHREEAFVEGTKAVWDKRSVESGVVWFRSRDNHVGGSKEATRVGLRVEITERMRWEQESAGWVDGNEKEVRVVRREEFRGKGSWIKFGCYVLVERFVLKRMDGSIALAYDFRHIHQIRSKWGSDDCELSGVAKNIGDHIHRFFPQAAILLLDSKKLGALEKAKDRSPVMQLYTKDASKNWKLNGSDGGYYLATKEPSANVVLLDYISIEKWQGIVDFDDHLDDISKDWLNPELFK